MFYCTVCIVFSSIGLSIASLDRFWVEKVWTGFGCKDETEVCTIVMVEGQGQTLEQGGMLGGHDKCRSLHI